MGLFDRFRRKPSTAVVAAAAPTTAPPAVPAAAKIATFSTVDEVGALVLDDGSSLGFGRSACRGFEPMVGVAVTVRAVAARGRGTWRATELALASSADEYDGMLRARDTALGAPPPGDAVAQAAATCHALGWIVVLLDEAPPEGPQAFAAWARRLGLDAHGIRIDTNGPTRIGSGRHDALAYVGSGPFPAERLAQLGASNGFDPGAGFIGLSFGAPGFPAMTRQIIADDAPDPWGPDGPLRELSKIALALLEHGRGIVLPQAGRVFDAARARARLGDVSDLESRPFGAWVAWAVDPELRIYATYGMCLHALPDVQTTVDPDDPADLDRAQGAILYACHYMVWSNAPLVADDILEVPVGIEIGPYPITASADELEHYLVVELPPAIGETRTCISLQRVVASS